jgi:hypothetical protein
MDPPTLVQTLKDPISLTPWVCFRGGGSPNPNEPCAWQGRARRRHHARRALHAWAAWAQRAGRLQHTRRRLETLAAHRTMVAVFGAWRLHPARAAAAAGSLLRVHARTLRRAAAAWCVWAARKAGERRARGPLLRAAGSSRRRRTAARVLSAWRATVCASRPTETAAAAVRAQRGVGVGRRRTLATALAGWAAVGRQYRSRLRRLERCASHGVC